MKQFTIGFIIILILVFSFMFAVTLATYLMSGVVIFIGMLIMMQYPAIKRFMANFRAFLDIALFAVSGLALFYSGVTISIALAVNGLLFSIFLSPYLKHKLETGEIRRY